MPHNVSPEHAPWRTLIRLGAAYYPALISFWMITAWTTLMLAGRGVDAAWVGMFAGLPWVAVLVVSPWVARMKSRLGWRATFQVGNGLAAVSVAGFLLTDSLGSWCVWACFSGAAVAIRWIIADAWAAALTPVSVQGRMVGGFETLAGTAIAIGPALVAWTGLDAVWSGVVLSALLGFSSLSILMVNEPIDAVAAGGEAAGSRAGRWFAGGLIVVAVVFAGGFLETGVGSMLPVFGLARGLEPEVASLLMTAANASALFLQWPTGWMADRFGPGRVILGAAVATLLASAALAGVGGTAGLFVTVFVWGGATGMWYTLGRIVASRQRPDRVVEVMTTVAMLYTLGAIVGPSASGLALSIGGVDGFAMATVGFAAVIGLLAWRFRANE